MRKQIDEELKEGTQSSHDSHTADDVSIPTPGISLFFFISNNKIIIIIINHRILINN